MKGFDYKVTKQYLKDLENPVALFKTSKDASDYALWCLEKDVHIKVETLYRVYDEDGILQTYTSKDVKPGSSSSSSSENQSSVHFRPTPFPKTPAPVGARTYTSFVENEDDKKNE